MLELVVAQMKSVRRDAERAGGTPALPMRLHFGSSIADVQCCNDVPRGAGTTCGAHVLPKDRYGSSPESLAAQGFVKDQRQQLDRLSERTRA